MSNAAEVIDAAIAGIREQPATPVAEQQVRLYEFSSWVHVGPGAENCEAVNEEASENACSNPLHFHAWCRLPNQFQHRDIRELAMAAKARRARQLRNEGTDAHEILEAELDEIRMAGEAGKETLVEELIDHDWWRDYMEAAGIVRERESDDPEPVVIFEHVDRDQERFRELEAKPEDERGDEYVELESHLAAYGRAVNDELEGMLEPKRDALMALDMEGLIAQVRDLRIDAQANQEFLHVYAAHSWQACTYRQPNGERVFASVQAMHEAPPEVIAALQFTFEDFNRSEGRMASGNS